MEILQREQYPEYEAFIRSHENGGFTQSIHWPKVKNNWQYEIVASRDENGALKGAMLVLIMKIPLVGTSMLYCPRGPVCDYHDKETLKDLLDGGLEVAKRYNGHILKWDPCVMADDTETIEYLKKLGFSFTPGAKHHDTIQTRHNYLIRLPQEGTEDDLFMTIGRKSRYCVRYAIKNGVECRICDKKEGIDDFYKIYCSTGERDEFSVRPKEYLQRFLDAFGDDVRLYITYYGDEPITGAITVQVAGKTCHVYGATSNEHRDLNANYLMQWEMIRWAFQNHCSIYDFQGVTIDPEENEHLYGVYMFKKSFKNGELVEYAGEFDYIVNPTAYALIQNAQKAKEKVSSMMKKKK